MKNEPKATCNLDKGTLTITLPPDMRGSFACDWFAMIADGIKDRAWAISDGCTEDAKYLELIADAVQIAVNKAEKKRQQNIAGIFG